MGLRNVMSQAPECSSISEIPGLLSVQGGLSTLVLVSERTNDTETGYRSFGITHDVLANSIDDALSVWKISSDVEELKDWNAYKALLSNRTFSADMDMSNPYVPSSFTLVSNIVSSVGFFRLSAGMETEFGQAKFTEISAISGFFDYISSPTLSSIRLSYDPDDNYIQLNSEDGVISTRVHRNEILSDFIQDISNNFLSAVKKDKRSNNLSLWFNVGGKPIPVVLKLSDLVHIYDFEWEGSGLCSIGGENVSVGVDYDHVASQLSGSMGSVAFKDWIHYN